MTVGTDIQLVRSSYGLTTHDVAAESGYKVRLIGQIEADQLVVSETMIAKILKSIMTFAIHGPDNVPEVFVVWPKKNAARSARSARAMSNPYKKEQ